MESFWEGGIKRWQEGISFICTCSQCFKGGHNYVSTNRNRTIRELQMRRNYIINACLKSKYPV